MDTAFAQTTQTTAKAAPGPPTPAAALLSSPLPVVLFIGAFFYFLILRPQNAERKKREETLKAIQRGDRVLTRRRLYGTVADIKDQILILKINENNKVEVDRSYVETVQKSS